MPLTITIAANDKIWDQAKQEFIVIEETTLRLEHSLISMSKWESAHGMSLLENFNKSNYLTLDYIRCMVMNHKDLPLERLYGLTEEQVVEINDYINNPQTATTFSVNGVQQSVSLSRKGTFVTSELIYYWMIAHGIPFECEKWPLGRLLTLIRICNIKAEESSGKNPKMNQQDITRQNRELNELRKKQYGTRG